ncbi:alpha/beta fold hydrolase [Aegicerativicinus sediminis]|uniref:alpha/beta fold hydrolase n=1 Tax=Aegicerativicinus sediminis TaxID=2893202 RepID=UPI001E538667|nr:alpha/beta fold hydrolase [Aegicerativicinus sediminis]
MIKLSKIKINDLQFDVRSAGDPENELVFFLHGFPETSAMWTELMKKISGHGFYCVAPNLRGYSKGACPRGKKNYTIDKLQKDVFGISDLFGNEKFHLVAHDWGAIIAWHMAFDRPDRILTYTALSVPHPTAFKRAYKEHEEQRKKSSYIKLFMIPFLSEFKLRKNNLALLRKLWKHTNQEVLEDYVSVFSNKKSLTAALNYYRANMGGKKGKPIGKINVPTLLIWGNSDLAVSRFAVENNQTFMGSDYKFVEVEGGHWLVQTNFEETYKNLISHLSNPNSK